MVASSVEARKSGNLGSKCWGAQAANRWRLVPGLTPPWRAGSGQPCSDTDLTREGRILTANQANCCPAIVRPIFLPQTRYPQTSASPSGSCLLP